MGCPCLPCLQTWVGTPAIYVFDCSAAGQILYSFRVSEQEELALLDDGSQASPGCPNSVLSNKVVPT